MAGKGKHDDCPSCRRKLLHPAHDDGGDNDSNSETIDPNNCEGVDEADENGLFVVVHGLVQKVQQARCSIARRLSLSMVQKKGTEHSASHAAAKACDCGCESSKAQTKATATSTRRTSAVRFQLDSAIPAASGRPSNTTNNATTIRTTSVANSSAPSHRRVASAGPSIMLPSAAGSMTDDDDEVEAPRTVNDETLETETASSTFEEVDLS